MECLVNANEAKACYLPAMQIDRIYARKQEHGLYRTLADVR